MEGTNFQIAEESIDDEAYSAYSNYSGDDGESIADLVGQGLNAVGTLLNPIGAVSSRVGSILGIKPAAASTQGIQQNSNLRGAVQTSSGKQIPVNLPSSVATKQDVSILQGAIHKLNAELSKVAETTNNNGAALAKNVAATKKQSDLIQRLAKGVDKLEKDVKAQKDQSQMMMMMSMFMQPEIDKIKFNGPDISFAQDQNVTTSSSSDNSMLPLLLMSGNNGSGDFSNNPMMMLLLMKAFAKP